MKELTGKYTNATIYAVTIEDEAVEQIQTLIDNPVSEGSKICMMPDSHKGKGCTIGTTMTINDKVCPNLVGVDLGCGVLCVKFLDVKKDDLDLAEVDKKIRGAVPLGFNVHDEEPEWCADIVHKLLGKLTCKDSIENIDRIYKSVGTLGGGNHYIELNEDSQGCVYLVIHTGSRNLGQQVATYHQKIAEQEMMKRYETNKKRIIQDALQQDKMLIEEYIAKHKIEKPTKQDLALAYLTGDKLDDYLKDVAIVQEYATINRSDIAAGIIEALGIDGEVQAFESVHNYVDVKNGILRKGAISAQDGEPVIIPLNMRDGSILAIGKGNPEWNYSAPHGAGRIMSRKKAQQSLSLEDFERTMSEAGVFTTSVSKQTLDEAPFVYKNPNDILDVVGDTLEIIEVIKPIYNLKG